MKNLVMVMKNELSGAYYLLMGILFANVAANVWNPKGLFEGIIDAISYIVMIFWVIVLANYGIKRKFLPFVLVFFFGGMALSMLNSNTRTIAIDYMGRALQAILNAK